MRDEGGGKLRILDKSKQHKAYAEAGSFGNYLFQTYGINRIKRFHRLSIDKDRPWQDVFGIGLPELEADWHKTLITDEKGKAGNVAIVLRLLESNPGTAGAEAQKLVAGKRQDRSSASIP